MVLVKDSAYHMAIVSRNVQVQHEQRERLKSAETKWEPAAIGSDNLIGAKKDMTGRKIEEGKTSYKTNRKSAERMKIANVANSDSRKKTQHQYLPVFTVRDEFLHIIRENVCNSFR